MAQAAGPIIARVNDLLSGDSGLAMTLPLMANQTGIPVSQLAPAQVVAQNAAPEAAEKAGQVKYPAVYVYCERVQNTLREKFRTFSGTARMVAEARVSQDRLEGLDQLSRLYGDAVTAVLDNNRGDWGNGTFFAGAYEVSYGPIKHGGKNYLQAIKITFDVDISKA